MPPRVFVYILRCADGTLYTGYTKDLNRRLKQHQSGNGGKYTHSRTPVELVYREAHRSRREAMQREASIKSLPRAKKLLLIGQANFAPKPEGSPHSRKGPKRPLGSQRNRNIVLRTRTIRGEIKRGLEALENTLLP